MNNNLIVETTYGLLQQIPNHVVVDHGHKSSAGFSHVSISLRPHSAIARPSAPADGGDHGDAPDDQVPFDESHDHSGWAQEYERDKHHGSHGNPRERRPTVVWQWRSLE